MFFKQETIENEKREHCFFIPIVEQIKVSDYNKEYIWNLAKEASVKRKFYSSPELLAHMESGRLAKDKILSCYKILLTKTQREQLTTTGKDSVLIGSLHFISSDIEKLIRFVHGQQQEHANPFYEKNTAINQFSMISQL